MKEWQLQSLSSGALLFTWGIMVLLTVTLTSKFGPGTELRGACVLLELLDAGKQAAFSLKPAPACDKGHRGPAAWIHVFTQTEVSNKAPGP